MKIECVESEANKWDLQKVLSESIKKLEEDGNVLIDIKHIEVKSFGDAEILSTIMYCDHKELRNRKLMGILSE